MYSGNCGPGTFETTRFQIGLRVAASENVIRDARENTAGGMNCVASWSSSAGSALCRSLAMPHRLVRQQQPLDRVGARW